MESSLDFDKIAYYEKPNEEDESEKIYDNFYNNSKSSYLHRKRKAKTQNNDTEKIVKSLSKKIKTLNNSNSKKKKHKKIKSTISKKKSLSSRTENRKRARTPIKEKPCLEIFIKEKVEKIEQKKEKKFKEDDNISCDDSTVLNNFIEKYDNSNMLDKENIFEEMEQEEKFGKEETSHLQELLCSGTIFEQGEEQQDEDEVPNLPQTQAFTILLNEN